MLARMPSEAKGSTMLNQSAQFFRQLKSTITSDFESSSRYQAKYHGVDLSRSRLSVELVRKIGLQMMASVRLMQCLEEAEVPLLPQVVSRLIRYLYAAEIHWEAEFAPGVSIVHGNGLVVSHAAKVGAGCILFHNVTLGEGTHPETREVGAPTLHENVHVGPGATLIGPIDIGAGTKIMAGAVLTHSVPPNSLVQPGESTVVPRRYKPEDAGKSVS